MCDRICRNVGFSANETNVKGDKNMVYSKMCDFLYRKISYLPFKKDKIEICINTLFNNLKVQVKTKYS